MSKSSPENSIFIHDSQDDVKRKINKAYCPQGELENNPIIEICKYIIFKNIDTMTVSRPEKFGGDLEFNGFEELKEAFETGQLHPQDLKNTTAAYLSEILEPVREYFEKHPENYENFKSFDVTR